MQHELPAAAKRSARARDGGRDSLSSDLLQLTSVSYSFPLVLGSFDPSPLRRVLAVSHLRGIKTTPAGHFISCSQIHSGATNVSKSGTMDDAESDSVLGAKRAFFLMQELLLAMRLRSNRRFDADGLIPNLAVGAPSALSLICTITISVFLRGKKKTRKKHHLNRCTRFF